MVKGVNFVELRDAGDPVELANVYNRDGADELVFLDITASSDQRGTMVHVVENTARQVFIPLTVGGGIRSIADARKILTVGADKVSINTAAVERPELISELSQEFGAQATVLAVDARRRSPGNWNVFTYGGRKDTGIDAVEWARKAEALGAGEILLTSMDRDGTQVGFDCDLTRAFSRNTHIPIIASGRWRQARGFRPRIDRRRSRCRARRLDLSLWHLHRGRPQRHPRRPWHTRSDTRLDRFSQHVARRRGKAA